MISIGSAEEIEQENKDTLVEFQEDYPGVLNGDNLADVLKAARAKKVMPAKRKNELVYIGADLPDEYTHSNYTYILKGANAKAKANAAQGLPELLMIADEKEYEINRKEKHSQDAKYGWYSYVTRFALPVYGENENIERYNVFQAIMLVRHAEDGKLYLYDIIKIKKETSNLFQS